MSILFEHYRCEVWFPGNVVARMLLAQVQLMEAHMNLPSGLSPVVSDEVQINFAQLGHFLARIAELMHRGNLSLRLLWSGSVIHLTAIFQACGGSPGGFNHKLPAEWVEEASDLQLHSMTTFNVDQ